jgi:hypothetical protein
MTDMAKTMAGTALGLGSIALVGEGLKMSGFAGKKGKKAKKTNFIKGATNIMVGTALLGGAGKIVNDM